MESQPSDAQNNRGSLDLSHLWSNEKRPQCFNCFMMAGESGANSPCILSNDVDRSRIARVIVRRVLEHIGEDAEREGLQDTPARVVKSWSEIFAGYTQNPAEILKREFESDGYDQMIVCREIEFYSVCEHHMLPFFGKAHIGYIPGNKVVGLSKLARLVDIFARRLQIQERLTKQIADALDDHLKPKGAGVMIEAKHFCMICRGVQKQNSSMITSALRGVFLEPGAHAEFLDLIRAR